MWVRHRLTSHNGLGERITSRIAAPSFYPKIREFMAQFVFTMNRVGKVVPPKREILKDISLSFFPGAKIGLRC